MMYFTARHEDVKLGQDATGFVNDEGRGALIICDGIGEFADSDVAAKTLVNAFQRSPFSSIAQILGDKEVVLKKRQGLVGGSTLLLARQKSIDCVRLEFLGNGGAIHLTGDFAESREFDVPYRYSNILNPHVKANRSLYKHVSHHSARLELRPSFFELNLNSASGDIILVFSDGISSLEERVIIKDDEGRYWRHESSSVQFIISRLHNFLIDQGNSDFQTQLLEFNQDVIRELKKKGELEDDASLGIIITTQVLDYYQETYQ